jgi:hypothetical protein
MEEDGTHDSAAEDGRKALVSALQDEATKQLRSAIRTALGTGTLPDFTKLASQIQDKVADAAKAAMKHATVSVFSFLPITSLFDIAGIVDPDDYIGSGTLGPFSFGEVATAGNAGKAFVLDLTGQGEGRYRVSGRIVRTSPDVEIVAAFGSSKASGDQVVHGTWSKFNSQWSTLSKAGKRLLSVATYVDGTDRIYVGVFRTGNENGYYLVDTDLSSFSTLRKQLNVDGLHVAGLQSYLANGTPRVVATFLPGPGREEMVIAPWDKFNSAGDKLKKEGMRLDRITVHGHGNNWDWVGIYHEAQDAQAFWVGDWSSFISQSNAQHKAGLRLRSVASYATPTGVLYAGVFRTGGEAEHIVRVSGWTAFDTLSQKQAAVHCLPLCVAVC